MGRTLPTSRHILDGLEFDWREFRRCLTLEEQRLFDALWQKARAHASAMSNQAPLDPMHAVFLSMLLEMQREVRTMIARNDERWGATPQTPRLGEVERLKARP